MKAFKNHTLREYLDVLASRNPVPGGGSAAALTGALGTALLSMAAQYSVRKSNPESLNQRIQKILLNSEKLRKRLLELVDLDAQAYLNVVKSRQAGEKAKKTALAKAASVPREVCRLCYRGVELLPYLVEMGNHHLISDIEVAAELLLAAFNAAVINVEVNS